MEQQLEDLVESDTKFREQFDRESEIFHKGDPRPVPIGGQRVPDGMTELPETPVEEQKIPDDPRYEQVMSCRSFLQEYKKTVSLVCPVVEARLRLKAHKNDEEREKLLRENYGKIEEVVEKVRQGQPKTAEMLDLIGDYSQEIQFIVENSFKEYSTKEEYGDFMLRVGIFTKKIFKDIQTLLQVIKDIKKGKVAS